MHYSKVVLITLFASATTIGAIGPAQYGAIRARAYHDRLNARDPVADAYADPYDEEGVYARAPNADAYADPFDEEGIYARDPVADADADAYDEGEIDARDAFGAEYHAHALDARAPPGSTYPRTKSPSRQGTGAKNQHPGTPKTPAAKGDLNVSAMVRTQVRIFLVLTYKAFFR